MRYVRGKLWKSVRMCAYCTLFRPKTFRHICASFKQKSSCNVGLYVVQYYYTNSAHEQRKQRKISSCVYAVSANVP